MNLPRILSPRKCGTSSSGMALVITLSALVLLTVLVLAFFSRAQCNRQISYSSTNLLGAKSIARSSLDIITGELRAEIADATRSTLSGSNGVWLYQPKNSNCLLPAQTGLSGATGQLLKVSADNTPIRPNGTIKGSSYSISTHSLEGRSISADRWYTSITSSPRLGSQATLPTWLFLTRGNGVQTPASVSSARDKANNDYVIGRFAYTVYDIGQLMDANIAGYPTLASGDAAYKPSIAYADLTALGFTATNVSDLLAWRNAVSATSTDTFKEWAAGIPSSSGALNSAALATARSGHLSIVNGDNAFLSRRDLLNHPSLGTSGTSLTHFSRSVNGPSSTPLSVTATNPNLPDIRFSADTPAVTHYQDNGKAETYGVQAGDFLLQRRFSLAKLAWLTHDGPLSGISDDAIKACFGLKWDSANYKWSYVGDGTTEQTTIKTLADVATANREPNFFELLQAGILEGSLAQIGKSFGQPNYGSYSSYGVSLTTGMDSVSYYQIIRIGANIIDQCDADSYPTAISFDGYQFYGIEDLPYLNEVLFKFIGTSRIVNGVVQNGCLMPVRSYIMYQLWNPHQVSTISTQRPTRFRVRIGNNSTYQLSLRSGLTVDSNYMLSTAALADANIDETGASISSSLEFDAATTSNDPKTNYREPRVIRTGGTSTLRTDLDDPTYGACQAIRLPDIVASATTLPYLTQVLPGLNKAIFILEYQDAEGWHPYTTFTGNEEGNGVTGIQFSPALAAGSVTGVKSALFLNKPDPRTFRLNAHDTITPQDAADTSLHASSSDYIFDVHGSATYVPKFITPLLYYNLSMMAYNNASITDNYGKNYCYKDYDGNVRPADASYGVNPYALGDSTARPIILNRPFRSVGELGYVFRDMPWKTLDLFSDKSADGALLDLFALWDEPPLIAGRVNLNNCQATIQQSLFSGVANISHADTLASSFTSYSSGSSILNVAKLPYLVFSKAPGSGDIPSKIKTEREAPVRALASASQTRTWNLLIDVVAQSGRYTSSSSTLDDFMVEGETRYWLSVAIDRYTGKIIDQQLENANEH